MMPPADMEQTRKTWLLIAALVLAATLPYAQSVAMGFVYDDHAQIEDNPHLRVWPGFVRVFSSDVWSMTDVDTTSNYYRPFMWLTYNAIFAAFGATPWAFHLFNLMLHAGVTVVVFLVSRKLWNDLSTAALAAFLFAVHPVHVEPIAWIGAMPELAFSLLLATAFYFYIGEPAAEWKSAAAYLGCFAAALLWKESAITFVLLIGTYDIVVVRKLRIGRWAGIAGVTVAYLGVRALALGGMAPKVIRPGVSGAAQWMTAFSNVGFYLGKLAAPVNLALFYPVEIIENINLRIIAVALVLVFAAWKFRGRLAFSALWIVVPILPVLLVTRVAMPLADRNLYLASIGFCWILARAFVTISKVNRQAALLAAGLLVATYVGFDIARVPDWRDDMSLLNRGLKVNPGNEEIHLNMAAEFSRQQKYREALASLDRVLEIKPAHVEALLSRAEAQVFLKDWAGVESTCTRAFSAKPDTPRCYLYDGMVEQERHQTQKAWEDFDLAYRGNPRLWQAPLYQGTIAFNAGDLPTALAKFQAVVAQHPSAQAYNNLAGTYLKMGETEQAIIAYETALSIDPGYEQARRILGALRQRN